MTADTQAEHGGAPVARPAGVRVHTDPAAASLADSLDAEALTWDRNVFFGSGRYAPGTPAGDRLLRHEFAHATRHARARAHLKPVTKRLDFLVIKKIPIGVHRTYMAALLDKVNATAAAHRIRPPKGQEDGGHWWVEVGMRGGTGSWLPVESYGWWPVDLGRGAAKPMYAWEVLKLKRIPGQLNQGRGKDEHHGDRAPVMYHPAVTFDDTLSYERVRQDYEDRVRGFASGFSGSWNWRWNWGKNCHTFIERLERTIGARRDDSKPLSTDPRNRDAMFAALSVREKPRQEIVTRFATLRGLGAADLLAGLDRLKMMGTVTEGDLRTINSDDEVRQAIIDLVGAPVNVINNAVGALWPGWGSLFSA